MFAGSEEERGLSRGHLSSGGESPLLFFGGLSLTSKPGASGGMDSFDVPKCGVAVSDAP